MNLKIIDGIVNNIRLSGFRSKRDEFYESLAKSYESRELLKDFLRAELKISNNPKTRDESRAYGLSLMNRRLLAAEDSDVSTILAAAMPDEDKLMLAAVKEAQDKPAVLRALAAAIVNQKEMKAVLMKAILPPLMILPGIFGFCYVMATKSIPMIVKMAPPEVWTPFNMFVRNVAELIGGHMGAMIMIVGAIIMITSYQLPRWTGKLRSQMERIPPGIAMLLLPVCPILVPISIYRDAQAGLMLSSLAVFLQSGRTLMDALETISRAGSPWMRWHVRKILSHLQLAPTDYINAFSKGLLSPGLLARLASTIRTNPRFDQVLIQVGTIGNKEIREQVSKQASSINFMVLVFGGVMVVLMMGGQLSITGSMQDEMSPSKMQARRLQAQQAASER